jgi:hypothetical protein
MKAINATNLIHNLQFMNSFWPAKLPSEYCIVFARSGQVRREFCGRNAQLGPVHTPGPPDMGKGGGRVRLPLPSNGTQFLEKGTQFSGMGPDFSNGT